MSADDEMSSLDRGSDSRAPAREPVSDRRSEAPTGSDVSGGGTSVARRSVSREGMALHSGSGLHRLAVATAGATLVLLFLGGLVTSTGSGLAVPDWPLSFGQVFPPMVGGVLFEHGHRLAATVVGCLTVVLALWTVVGDGRASVRALGLLAGLTTGAVFGQLVLGALVRHMHAGLAIPDFPLAFGRLVPPLVTPYIAVHFAHRVGALVVLVAVGSTAVHVLRHTAGPWVRRPALLAAGLVILQVTLGALTIWSRRAVLPTTAHLVVGAALLATCLVLTLRATRVTLVHARTVEPAGVRREAL